MKNKTFIILMFLLCCYNCYSQDDDNSGIDTIFVWEGHWFRGGFPPEDPEDYMFLTIERQNEVYFQEKTHGFNKITVILTADYIVDSLGIMNFVSEKVNFYRLSEIEDYRGEQIYYCGQDNEEIYGWKFDYSCLKKLYDYLKSFVERAKLSSQMHGYEPGKEGTYAFAIKITPNNIECFKKLKPLR